MYRLVTSFDLNTPVDNTKSNEILSSSLNDNDALFSPNNYYDKYFNPHMSFKICKSRISFLGLKGLREGIKGVAIGEYRAAVIEFVGNHSGFLNTNGHVPHFLKIKKFNEWEIQDIIIPAKSYFDSNNLYPKFELSISSINLSYDGIGIQTIYNGRAIIPFIELLIDDTELTTGF